MRYFWPIWTTANLFGFLVAECDMKIMNFPLPNIFHHQISSGHVLYSIMYQPPALDPKKKYPVVLNIYGGPDYQLVTNTFKVSEWVVQNHFVHLTVALYSNKYTKATNCGCKTILKCLILHILMFFEDFVTFIFSLIHRWFLTFFVHWSQCCWGSKLIFLLLQYHRFSSLFSIVFN